MTHTKNIGLQKEVWKELKTRKRPGQSYSGLLVEELGLEVELR